MKADRKQTILFVIVLLILSMGIGYAFLTTSLSIDGVSDIDSAVWDIHFENIQIDENSVYGDNEIVPATIGVDGKTISFHVKLNEPGDMYGFDVDIVNGGTLSSIFEDFFITYNGHNYHYYDDMSDVEFPAFIKFITSESRIYGPLEIGTRIDPGETKGIGYAVVYDSEVDPSDLPAENSSINLVFNYVFSQATSNYYSYASSGVSFSIVSPYNMPNNLISYNTAQEAIDNFEHDVFIRYRNNSGKMDDFSIGFKYNNRFYYMIPDADHIDSNIELLNQVLGDSNCHWVSNRYECSKNNYSFRVRNDFGYITIGANDNYGCITQKWENGLSAECEYLMM